MNESLGKTTTTTTTTSSLAITEKKTRRPGGSVGIFFQLFNWNRRFAEKKLFSKRLLPPVRSKHASKKFRGDEKMPKLHLIADENKGGFPNMKKHGTRSVDLEHSYETRSPSLVARLMGLESMPAICEKPKKGFSDGCGNGEKKFVNEFCSGSGKEGMNLERGSIKQIESRPQKLQKTRFERKAVTKFGAEALQIKSVLSRSRKHHHHHHPKFVSPVKSPRIPSGKNVSRTSRLFDAARKILEPGLQSTSKAKCAITYSSSVHYPPNNEVVTETVVVKSEELPKQSCYGGNVAKSRMGQSSFKNCGNLLDVVDCRPNVDDGPSAFPSFSSSFVSGSPSEGTERSKPRLPISSVGQKNEEVFHRSWDQPVSQKKEKMVYAQLNSRPITERKSLPHEGQAPWQSLSQPCNFQSSQSSSFDLKHRVPIQEQTPLGRDRIPPRSKVNNLDTRRVSSAANAVRGTKDFVSLNRSLSGRTRPKVTTKEENSKFVPERKAYNGRDESLPQLRSSVRKRRTNNLNGQVESRGFLGSTPTKSRSIPCDSLTGKVLGLNALPMDRTCVRCRLVGPREGNGATKSNSNDVISFTFNSPIRQKPGSSSEMVEKTMDDDTNKSFQQPVFLKGDSIAALLEQKLKELTSQEDDELAIGGPPKKSTAMILQELISALTAERPDIALPSIVRTKHEGSAGVSHVVDHLSPGSVLEASFSSSSLDESSGHMVYTDSVNYSSDNMHNLGPDTDILDSATSLGKEMTGCERVTALVSNVSRILDSINFDEGRLTESKLVHAKDVMVNAELLFGNVTLYCLDGTEGLFIGPILLDLETVAANVAWTNISVFTNGDANKTGNQFKVFLFDCLVECLDSKYGQYTNSKLEAWTRFPSCMNRERIIGELEKEMNKWTSLAGMIPDKIVEWEMSHGLGKWTNFDIEAFEAGDEVCCDIFEALVDETLIDLWECRRGSF